MGVQADNMQIGQSGTNSQNFNIRTALDGVLRLSRGGKGVEISDPLKIEANNDVTLLGNLLSGVFGTGQNYVDLASSRVFDVNFVNTTGKAIFVCLFAISTVTTGFNVIVNGVGLSGTTVTAGVGFTLTIAIPAGATYQAVRPGGTLSNIHWWEMR